MKISIRKLTDEDLQFVNEVRNGCAEEFLHDSRTFTIEDTLRWYKKTLPDFYIIENDGEKIGYFRVSNYSHINKNLYVGADIHPDFRNKGFASYSYSKFIPFLFKMYDLHKISLEVLSTNEVAMKLYTKLGFKIDGIKRDEVLKQGKFVDSVIMSLLKNE